METETVFYERSLCFFLDCGGKVCMTGGKLNVDTCECNCGVKKNWIDQSDCSGKWEWEINE